VRTLLVRILAHQGYRCTPASDVAEAVEVLATAPFQLMVCDVRLPDGSGLDLVADALGTYTGLAALVVSGLDDVEIAQRALNVGAYGYIVKPFTANEVLIAVLGALRSQRRSDDSDAAIKNWQEEIVERLCIAVEARDHETATHIDQMSTYCRAIAERLGLAADACDLIHAASPMHDVGKIAVPDRVLLKPAALSAVERTEMQEHAEVGYRILAGSRAPLVQLAASIAWTHHERVDGEGYPRHLSGDQIPAEGRIAAVADVFDALTRDRVYRRRFARTDALEIMRAGRGTHFDPDVLDAFLSLERERPATTLV
jgi:putative two-component system response regulator